MTKPKFMNVLIITNNFHIVKYFLNICLYFTHLLLIHSLISCLLALLTGILPIILIINILIIVLIIISAGVGLFFWFKKNKNAEVEQEIEKDEKTYTLETMREFVKKRLDEITKVNLYYICL